MKYSSRQNDEAVGVRCSVELDVGTWLQRFTNEINAKTRESQLEPFVEHGKGPFARPRALIRAPGFQLKFEDVFPKLADQHFFVARCDNVRKQVRGSFLAQRCERCVGEFRVLPCPRRERFLWQDEEHRAIEIFDEL